MSQKSGTPKPSAEKVIKGIRRVTRKHYGAEEKICIVPDGLCGEASIDALCRREGIAENPLRQRHSESETEWVRSLPSS